MPLKLSAAAAASQGARPYQEDTSAIWQPPVEADGDAPLLAVVADGMGGHVSGEVASQVACQAFIETFSAGNGAVRERLEQSLIAANNAIASAIEERPELNGMGCTLVAAYINDRGLWHVSVGDSLLLLLREQVLHGLNENHSFGAVLDQQAEAGLISPEDAQSNPRRNSLRSALTGERIALVDLPEEPYSLKADDYIVLASDGLDTLNGHEIADLVVGSSDDNAEAIAAVLLNAVDAHGLPNQDNTTVVALRVEEGVDDATKTVQWSPGRVGDADDVNTTITVSPHRRMAVPDVPTETRRSYLVPTLFFFGVVAASLAWLFLWAGDQKSTQSGGEDKAVSGPAARKAGGQPKIEPAPKPAKLPVKPETKPEPPKDSAPVKPGQDPRAAKSDGGSAGGSAKDAGSGKSDAAPAKKGQPKATTKPKAKARSKSESESKKAKPVPKAKPQKEGRVLPAPGAKAPDRFAQRRDVVPGNIKVERGGRRLLLPYPQVTKQ